LVFGAATVLEVSFGWGGIVDDIICPDKRGWTTDRRSVRAECKVSAGLKYESERNHTLKV